MKNIKSHISHIIDNKIKDNSLMIFNIVGDKIYNQVNFKTGDYGLSNLTRIIVWKDLRNKKF